jgi:hypothetical protein
MNRRLVPALALASALSGVLLPGRADGQEVRRVLESLQDSTRLRVLAPGLTVDDGRLLGLHGDSVRLSHADAVLAVGLDEIQRLSVGGSKWKKVGWQTGAVGAVAGLMAGYMVGAYGCSEARGCDREARGVAVRWGLGLGLTGAVVGTLVGSRLTNWRVVFP